MTKERRIRIKTHVCRLLAIFEEGGAERIKYWSWKDDAMQDYLEWCLEFITDLERCERRRKK